MLEYLIFTLNPPFQGELRVQVRVYDGSVQVTVESEDYPAENGDTWLEGEAAQRFLQALQNVRISGWRSAYAEDGPQDGMTWSIEYKQAGKHCRTISGRNAGPENWLDFLSVMDCVAPVLNPAQVDRISLEVNFPAETWTEEGASREFLVADRAKGLLLLGCATAEGRITSRDYYAPEDVSLLLDRIGALPFEQPAKAAEEAEDLPVYELTLERHKQSPLTISGLYGRQGLPACWHGLMEAIEAFRSAFGYRERLVLPRVYARDLRGETYLYCSVSFGGSPRSYYYRTDDPRIAPGDAVRVPFGEEERAGVVEAVGRFSAQDVPYPLERTKWILEKIDGES